MNKAYLVEINHLDAVGYVVRVHRPNSVGTYSLGENENRAMFFQKLIDTHKHTIELAYNGIVVSVWL